MGSWWGEDAVYVICAVGNDGMGWEADIRANPVLFLNISPHTDPPAIRGADIPKLLQATAVLATHPASQPR